jgi:hypothetical protein
MGLEDGSVSADREVHRRYVRQRFRRLSMAEQYRGFPILVVFGKKSNILAGSLRILVCIGSPCVAGSHRGAVDSDWLCSRDPMYERGSPFVIGV